VLNSTEHLPQQGVSHLFAIEQGNKTMKTQITVPTLLLAAFVLAACNTVEGVGRDVQAGGQAVEDVASDTKDEISGD
jgi:entericidin B